MALKNKEDYPLILTAGDISEILAVSKPTAYELMEQSSFPLIRIGRNKRVLKHEFFNWLLQQQTNSL